MPSDSTDAGTNRETATLLAARLSQLERDNHQLLEINQGLQAFTASATHDLRAPLHCLQLYQKHLRAALQPHTDALAACESLLQRQQATIDNMQQLIDGMLDLARIGHLQPTVATIDCNQLAATTVEQLQAQYPDHPVRIEIDCGPALHADPRLIHSLLQNLLSNAWKFTHGVAEPQVSLRRCADQPVPTFEVTDNGIGFDMRYTSRLFEPFQRLHASDFPGAGIGLATAARIVERHGGRIWAEAQPHVGATFRFTLPDAAIQGGGDSTALADSACA